MEQRYDLNDMLGEIKAGKISVRSIPELEAMVRSCDNYLLTRIPEAGFVKAELEKELVRQRAEQTRTRESIDSDRRHNDSMAVEREKLDQFEKLREEVAIVNGRIAEVEKAAARSQSRTWAFWIAVAALIVTVVALARDFFDWKM